MSQVHPILIVDDDADFCQLLRRAFAKAGLQSDRVASGEAALNWLAQNSTSLMLLDLKLPDYDGRALVEEMRRRGLAVPFVVITALADVRSAVELVKDGALDYLSKGPELMDVVVPLVERSLNAIERSRSLHESEQRFRRVAENLRDVLWIAPMDAGGTIDVNEAYTQVLGRDPAHLKTRRWDWLRAVRPGDRRRMLELLAALRAGGMPSEIEIRVQTPGGSAKWFQCRGFVIRGADGEVTSIGGIALDVTPRKDLERRLLQAIEQETRRIGRDLHDDVCQRLAAVQLKCGVLQGALAREHHSMAGLAGQLAGEVANASNLTRSLAGGMAPLFVAGGELPGAIKQLGLLIGELFGIGVTGTCEVQNVELDGEQASHLYRIAQELAANAARHGRSRRVDISLATTEGRVRLKVASDGLAFDGVPRHGAGMGLHFARQRADALGATLVFHPGPKNVGGTTVICDVPLPRSVDKSG